MRTVLGVIKFCVNALLFFCMNTQVSVFCLHASMMPMENTPHVALAAIRLSKLINLPSPGRRSFLSAIQKGTQKVTARGTGLPFLHAQAQVFLACPLAASSNKGERTRPPLEILTSLIPRRFFCFVTLFSSNEKHELPTWLRGH